MSNNFEWQKHQTNERIQARLHEAEIHRSLKAAKRESPSIGGKIIRSLRLGFGGLGKLVGSNGRLAETDLNNLPEVTKFP